MSYPKLDLSRDLQTRLLRILPGDDIDPLQCQFPVVSLSDDHEYFALSYQIPNMRFVYSKAAMVIVWLGASPEGALDVLNLLAELKRANDCLEKNGLKPDRSTCLGWMQEGAIPSFDNPVWKALDEFYRQSWFKRLWVVQEIVLAQKKLYMWGEHTFAPGLVEAGMIWIQYYQPDIFVPIDSEIGAAVTTESVVRIDWNELRASTEARPHDQMIESTESDPTNIPEIPPSGVQQASEQHPAEPEIPPGLHLSKRVHIDPAVALTMATVRTQSLSGTSIPLLHLLRATRTRQVSVTKDRIFALLGIADEANEEKHGKNVLKLNYAHNEYATFLFTARFLINRHKSLEVLKMVEYLPGCENEILTWVPRWDAPEFVRGNTLSEPEDQTGFAASANLPLRMEEDDVDATFTFDGQIFPSTLAVHGQRFDRVTYTSSIIFWADLDHGDQFYSTRIYDLYAEFKKNVQSKFGIAAYPTGQDFRAVFVMTAIAGLDEHGRPADADVFVRHFLHQYGNELEDDAQDQTLARKFRMTLGHGDLEMSRLQEEMRGGSRIRFLAAFKRAAEHRRLFLTSKGYIGLGPAAMKVDDHVCVLFGANVPYVYRNPGSKELYEQGYLGPLSGQQMHDNVFGMLYDDQAPCAAAFRSDGDFYLGRKKETGTWDLSWVQSSEPRMLIGHCYVHGVMHGEAVKDFQEEKRESVLFKFR